MEIRGEERPDRPAHDRRHQCALHDDGGPQHGRAGLPGQKRLPELEIDEDAGEPDRAGENRQSGGRGGGRDGAVFAVREAM